MSISALRLRSAIAFSASERGSLVELVMWGRLLSINDLRINAAGQPGSSRGRAGLAASMPSSACAGGGEPWRAPDRGGALAILRLGAQEPCRPPPIRPPQPEISYGVVTEPPTHGGAD